MAKRFSTIGLNPMVESVNRKFARRVDTCIDHGFGASTFMGCSSQMVNVVGVGQKQKNVMFFRRPIKPHAPGEGELEARNNFTAASKWVKKYYKDLSYLAGNMQKWDEARTHPFKSIKNVRAYGYTKMRNWMFAIAVSCIKLDGHVPATGAIPDFDA